MKKKKYFLLILLFLMFGITAPSSYRPVHAAAYVKAADAATDLTSRKNGWVKKDGYYYFYKKGRLICGRFTYKGKGYYCLKNGRRYTGWLVSKGKRYYYNRKNGIMFRNRWATGDKYKYIAQAMGVEGTESMTQEEYRKAAVDAVKKLAKDVGIPENLKDIVKKEDIPFLAQSAYDDACRPGNPKETSVADITELYESLI